MHHLLPSSILAFLALASPQSATPLQPRQADDSPSPPIAGIVASVTSSNGTDVTSAFQLLLYQGTAAVAASNLTDRDLTDHDLTDRDLVDRQVPGIARPINFCRRHRAEFKLSKCDYQASFAHTLQRYKVTCWAPGYGWGTERITSIDEIGHCNADEICVNGPEDARGMPTVASCVGQRGFEPVPDYDTPEGKVKLQQQLEEKMVSVVISEKDGQAALSVQSLEIDAGIAGSSKGVGGRVGPTSQEKCDNCAEVATGKLEGGTDYLSTEVKLSTAGPVAAGILWLTVLSG